MLRSALLSTLLVVVAVSSFALGNGEAEKRPSELPPGFRVYEMRTYYTNEGKIDDLHRRFREHTNALFVKHGMTLVGYWTPADDRDTLVYILAYPSREARKKSWDGFLNDPDWKAAYGASIANGRLVKKIDSTFLVPTEYSPVR